WPAEQRDRPEGLLADEGRRRAPFEQPRRMEFVRRALAFRAQGVLCESGGRFHASTIRAVLRNSLHT
ncbi:MAG: hypothetical protein ICV73_25790, partial [Acetobacteraceae bacterium]|nr:hypothetical protein [Acetobacteraceae bacterium]